MLFVRNVTMPIIRVGNIMFTLRSPSPKNGPDERNWLLDIGPFVDPQFKQNTKLVLKVIDFVN